jgi:hypothetical protein
MNLINSTRMQAGYTMFTDKSGRDHLVVVAKGTYGIPTRPDEEPELVEAQVPLVMCDEFTGEPGFSAPLYEIDFAPRKPRCDVLLNGSAFAPGGKPAERVIVGLQIGSLRKSFDVVGKRTWKAGKLSLGTSAIEPFVKQAISYDVAFGGVDRTSQDPTKHRWYLPNHVGVGYFVNSDPKAVDGKPMPNTEETGRPISSPSGSYKPMAFGPVARAWQPRAKWAGTFDERWLEKTAPFLPADFDDRYFQAAPEDQQMNYPTGGEQVTLINMTTQGRTTFTLPELDLPVVFFPKSGDIQEIQTVVDTIVLEPDKNQLLLVWRASLPLRRSLFEIRHAAVGGTASYWRRREAHEERAKDKRRFASLAALAAWNRLQQEDGEVADAEIEDAETGDI